MTKTEKELLMLSYYIRGFADSTKNERFILAANWLEKLAQYGVCSQGFIGCPSKEESCQSDHK